MAYAPPASVLVIGSGVFGLSTAEALSRRPEFASTTITVVDRGSGSGGGDDAQHFPARDAASIDSSRIIRPDYADPAYAALAAEAQEYWRGTKRRMVGDAAAAAAAADDDDYIGGGGRYTECGLVVVADNVPAGSSAAGKKTGMDYVRESWENVRALGAADAYLADR